jgi:phosphoglucosamine mutase
MGPVVIGQDSRQSGNMLAMALSAGLNAAGLDVWNLGLCPTPGVAYLTNTSEAIGGVMVSASHNPPDDNGIKFFGSNGSKLALALQEQIEAALRGKSTLEVSDNGRYGQHYYRSELLNDYLTAIQQPLVKSSIAAARNAYCPGSSLGRSRASGTAGVSLAWGIGHLPP